MTHLLLSAISLNLYSSMMSLLPAEKVRQSMPAGTDLSQVVSFRGIIKGNLKATKLHVAASLLFHFFVSTTAMAAAKGLRRWDRIIYASHEQVKVVMISLTAHGRCCLNDWFLIIRPRYVQRCSWIIVHLTSHQLTPHSTYEMFVNVVHLTSQHISIAAISM